MSFSLTQLLIVSLVFIVPIIIAFKLNKNFQEKEPECRPYRFGYFLALNYAITGVILPLLTISTGKLSLMEVGIQLIYITVAVVLALALYKRYFWPWVIVLLLLIALFVSSLITQAWFGSLVSVVLLGFVSIYVFSRNDELKPMSDAFKKDTNES